MNDDLERRLDRWGADSSPSVDGAFANRLDAELRELAGEPSAREQRPIWQPAVLALAALLVIAGGIFAFTRDGSDGLVLVMDAATRTEVVLPDGEIVAGAEGLILPDGTRITVAEDGSAVVADVVLEAGVEAIVRDGRLEILVDQRPVQSEPTSTTTGSDRPTTAGPTTTGPTTSPPSTRPTTSTTGRSTSTTVGSSTTAATRPPPPDRNPTTAPDAAVVLDGVERQGRVELTWTYAGPDTLAGWDVVVTVGDRSRTLALLRDPAARSIIVERGTGPASYRVAARGTDGTIIAESNRITVR